MRSFVNNWIGQPFTLSAATIQSIVGHTGSNSVSKRSPRFVLLDKSLAPIDTGVRGPYGDPGDISQYVDPAGCHIKWDSTQAVHRSMDITLQELNALTIAPLQHYIRVFADYWDASGNLQFEVPVGTFGFVVPDRDLEPAGTLITATMLGMTQRLARLEFINHYTIAAGTLVTAAVRQLLTQSYLPNSLSPGSGGTTPAGLDHVGPGFTDAQIVIHTSTATVPQAITYAPGDNQLTAINDLLSSISYYPLYDDAMGLVCCHPLPNYSVSLPPTGWTYNTDANSIIDGPVHWQLTNLDKLANCVVVWSEPANSKPLYAAVYNTTGSAIGSKHIGQTITLVIKDDKIPDQANCTLRAYLELQYAALKAEQVTFAAMANPFHDAHEHLGCSVFDEATGATLLSSPTGWEETAWELDLDAWTMSHTLGRRSVM